MHPTHADPAAADRTRDAHVAQIVKRLWGFDALRPLQHQAIRAGLDGRDSLVVLPTGGGKSLCYQVPPLAAERFDVVVSPLISLMKDQVDGLREIGYPAAALYTGQSRDQQAAITRDAADGRYRLLFVAPERLLTDNMVWLLREAHVRAFAIDEAHCISHWGHDFRPEYRQLARLREVFDDISIHAFTATATQRVRDDIAAQLLLRDPQVLIGTFDRPNLTYRVVPRVDVYGQALEVLRRHRGQAAIVYCITRKETEDLAGFLKGSGVRAAHYHAGMEPDARRRTQDAFAEEQLDVVVATVAFGMGIDRSDVRCVLHAAMPKSIEHYQQETGRAGRDGLPAECVLLYSSQDLVRWERLIGRAGPDDADAAAAAAAAAAEAAVRELLDHMRGYCVRPACRHRELSEYFGQAYPRPNCGACDVCLGELKGFADATVTAQKILSCVARVGERFGVGYVVEVLRGSRTQRIASLGHDRLSTFGLLKDMDEKVVANFAYQLVDQGLLTRTPGDMPIVKLNDASWEVMRGQRAVQLYQPAAAKATRADEDAWSGVDQELFESLRELRREIAAERHVPAFIILSDRTLRDLARRRPRSLAALAQVSGIGDRKRAELGRRLVEHIAVHLARKGATASQASALSVAASDTFGDEGELPLAPGARPVNAMRALAFEMFAAGASVDEVMKAVGRARSTTTDYLADFIERMRPRSVARWVDDATYARVSAAAAEVGVGPPLRPIFERLEGQVEYDLISLVSAHLRIVGELDDAPA